MAEAGRPAKPTHLKVLHGDRKDRINEAEPIPAEGEVVPPFALTKDALEVWDRLTPDRIAKGVLTTWDADAFAEFCEALCILRVKRRHAKSRPKPGQASPIQEYKAALSVVSTLGGRFGWTPADRAKLVTPRQEGSRGSKADLLSG